MQLPPDSGGLDQLRQRLDDCQSSLQIAEEQNTAHIAELARSQANHQTMSDAWQHALQHISEALGITGSSSSHTVVLEQLNNPSTPQHGARLATQLPSAIQLKDALDKLKPPPQSSQPRSLTMDSFYQNMINRRQHLKDDDDDSEDTEDEEDEEERGIPATPPLSVRMPQISATPPSGHGWPVSKVLPKGAPSPPPK